MLSIQLLGPPLILQDVQPLTITRKKSRALVYYLAAHDQPLTREQLLAFFWPDSDRVSAQQVLRTTLHGLRQALGTALITDDNTLALASDIDIDVRTFEARLQHPTSNLQSLTSTLQLYRGDFLTGFTLTDSAEFDDWLTEQQEHYRRLAIRGYIALAALHEQQQDYTAALDALDRALSFDPLQEDVQRSALRVHYLAGDRTGAIRRYDALRKLLDDELGIPPMAETRQLYDAIISDQLISDQLIRDQGSGIRQPAQLDSTALSNKQLAASNLPFTGRATELKKLREAAESRQLALIEGESGIGKTRLAAEFLRTQAGLILRGAAHELEHALPYQPFIDALRGLLGSPGWSVLRAQVNLPAVWWHELARLVPEVVPQVAPQAAPPTADEARLWEGVHQFLIALSRLQTITIFIDDVQWADGSTLGLLGYLARVTASVHPIVLVAASRPIEPRTPSATLVQSLMRAGRLMCLTLDRLSPTETTALAQQLSPAFAYPLTDWLMQHSEGNPYILNELITHARDHGILQPDGTVNLNALSAAPIVPPSIYSLIQARLSHLSDPARRILDAAVAMGRVFEFDVVARAAALSENAALDGLDELRAARLIEPQDGGSMSFTFDHSLTMEVAYREVGEPRHRLLHRRVAEAMEAIYGRQYLDGIAGILAWHFREGGDVQRAAPYALRAAQLAGKIAAWHEAIEFFEQALEAELPDQERVAILLELGDAQFRTGATVQASDTDRAALKLCAPDSLTADRARLALAQALLNAARYGEAIELVKQVCAAGRPEMIVSAQMQWGTTLSIEGADLIGAAEHLQNAETLLRQQADQPDAARLAQIKFELGSVAAQQGDLEKAVALYRDTIHLGAQSEQAGLPFYILGYNNLAYHLYLLHDPTALEYAQQGMQLARERGALGLQPFLFSTLGEIELARDVDAAEEYFLEGLALAERLSMPERIAGLTANLGRVALQRGETALAIHRLSTALAKAEALGLPHLTAQIRLWLVPLLPPNEAHAALNEVKAMAESSGRKRLLEEVQRLEQDMSS